MIDIQRDNKTLEQLISDYSNNQVALESEGTDKLKAVAEAMVRWFKQLIEHMTRKFRELFSKIKRSADKCKDLASTVKEDEDKLKDLERLGPVEDRKMSPKLYQFLKDGNKDNSFKDLRKNIEKFFNDPQFKTTHQYVLREMTNFIPKLHQGYKPDITDKYYDYISGVNGQLEDIIKVFEDKFVDFEHPVLAGGAKITSEDGRSFKFELPEFDENDTNHWIQDIDMSVFEYIANAPTHYRDIDAGLDWLDEIDHFGIDDVVTPLQEFKKILPPKNKEIWQRYQDVKGEIEKLERNYRRFISTCISFYNAYSNAFTAIMEYVTALGIHYVR